MNSIKKVSLVLAVFGCTASASLFAQTAYNPSWYIMPSIGVVDPDSRFDTGTTGPSVGLHFGKALSQNWDLQIGSTYSRTEGNNRYYDQTTLGADALYMLSRDNFRPFVLIGAGVERDTARRQTSNAPYLNAGLGFQYSFSDQWFAQVDVRRIHGFQRVSDFPFKGVNNNALKFGISYLFNKPVTVSKAQYTPAPAPFVAPVMQAAAPTPAPARFEQVRLSSTELFEFDRSNLRTPQPKLDEIARVLSEVTLTENVMISGYTDRLGSDLYNQKLSQERADAVKNYLVNKGVAANRLSAQGKGESNPVVNCNDKKRIDLIKCLEPNRRVEVEQITIERRVN